MPADCVIGVDLGGTKLLAGVVDGDLVVHHRAFRPAPTEGVLDALEEVVRELVAAHDGPVRAVGFGIPSSHPELADIAVADVLAERLGMPVAVDNDANVAMRAEHAAGAASGAAVAVMLTVGTGIGGAAVVDGRLVRGASGAADVDGPPGLPAVAAGLALEGEEAAASSPDSALGRERAAGRAITGALVTELAHDGDPAAIAAVERVGRMLGVGFASIANAIDPEVIVVGGGVIAAGELLLGPARAELEARALPPVAASARVEAARFGAESGMLGAALLAREAAHG